MNKTKCTYRLTDQEIKDINAVRINKGIGKVKNLPQHCNEWHLACEWYAFGDRFRQLFRDIWKEIAK